MLETIKYDSSNLINIKLDLYSAVSNEELKLQIEIMESLRSSTAKVERNKRILI